jgi:ABC-type transport system involved in multi-copper enzyme maturation permease subunit
MPKGKGAMKILGPVFWYDLVRVARRQRLALWRALYASALLVALYLMYASAFPYAELFGGARVKGGEMAAFATQFFALFAAVQFGAIILLTPALTASALAEERSQNTLLFLFTTHLTNREIILGKLTTRLLQIGLLVLTGLPVLGMMQLFGGVDLLLVVAAFVGAGVTALSLGALGIACAVFVKKPQNAAWRAYQFIMLYAAFSVAMVWLLDLPFAKQFARGRPLLPVRTPAGNVIFVPGTAPAIPPLTLSQQVQEGLNAANPLFAGQRILYLMMADVEMKDIVPRVLGEYVFIHGVFAIGCLGLAVAGVRSAAARQTRGLTVKKAVLLKPAPHPPIKDRPVLWKEIYCETKPRQRWLALFFTRWFFVASFLPVWILFVFSIDNFSRLTTWFYHGLAFGGTLVSGVLLLRVGAQAARAIGSERDRQTLDSLLTTLLSRGEIIRDKWRGALLSGRWVYVWLMVHWGIGMLAMAVSYLAVPLLAAEVVAFSAFMVSLGLYCSARLATTKQAVATTLVVALFGTTVVPWLFGQFLMWLFPGSLYQSSVVFGNPQRYQGRVFRVWQEVLVLGLTPVRMLYETVIPNWYIWNGYYGSNEHEWWREVVPASLGGIMFYGFLAVVLRRAAISQFRRSHGAPRRVRPKPQSTPVRRLEPINPCPSSATS